MKELLLLVRAYVVFVAASGFILGQFFFASFSIAGTVAGVFGVMAGVLGCVKESIMRKRLLFIACITAITGVGFDAFHYYKFLDISGNSYGWELIAPFVVGLAVIAILCAWQQRNDKA